MKAAEWIDHVKTVKGWETDYRVAKELDITRQAVSMYRGKPMTMDEDTATKVAITLGVDPAAIVIDQAAERSKSPAVQASLRRMARQLCILCKVSGATKKVACGACHLRAAAPSGH